MSTNNTFRVLALFALLGMSQCPLNAQISACDQNPGAIICDNMESYSLGNISPQSPWWKPWLGAEDNVLNGTVTTEQASDGVKSMKIKYEVVGNLTGDDQLLLLGNKTTGRYELSWKMYIPSGKAAYYNIQNSEVAGQAWNLDVYFDSIGTARILVDPGASQATDASFTFPFNQWFTIKHVIDLDNNLCKYFVDGVIKYSWGYGGNIGSIDFFAATAWNLFYLDEVYYISLPPVVYNADFCSSAIDLTQYFGFPADIPQTTPLYDNTNATAVGDPTLSCWNEAAGNDLMDRTMWYTFSGDGKTYHLETVPCNATNYIGSALPPIGGSDPDGDTQMALFSGTCGDLTQVACNDDLDLNGDPDWRAGLDFQTEAGKDYLMLIDGFNYGNGLVATGQYCIQITRLPQILCAQGSVGSFNLNNNGYVCFGTDLASIIQLADLNDYVIPDQGPQAGLCWAVTSVPVQDGVWAPSLGASYITSTGFIQQPLPVSLSNTQALANPILLYITPVVVGGATVTNPAPPVGMEDVNITDGCFYNGPSKQIILVPELNPIFVAGNETPPTNPQGNNGSILLAVEGGLFDYVGDPSTYVFNWSNGATTQNISGLSAGTYTVTVSDITGCVGSVTATFSILVSTQDPGSVKSFQLSPNPATASTQIALQLMEASDIQLELINLMGQTVESFNFGRQETINQNIDVSQLPNGQYFVRLTIDQEILIRKLIIQH